jgi:hypothetical protein
MSINSIKNKISGITDGGLNTALEMREVLTDITDTFSGATDVTLDTVTTNGNTTNNSIDVSGVTADIIQINNITGTTAVDEGQLAWNSNDGTLNVGMGGGNVTLQLGQEHYIHVKAKGGVNIFNGENVYASGGIGGSGKIEVDKYIADNSIDELYYLGVATEDINSGNFGFITTYGIVRDLDTSSWSAGTILYASETVAGEFTDIPPVSPNLQIVVAMVLNSNSNNGFIFVRPTTGFHVSELHDINFSALTDGDIMVYNSGTTTWENSQINLGGGTPGGANTQVQFNDNGAFGADSEFTFSSFSKALMARTLRGTFNLLTDGYVGIKERASKPSSIIGQGNVWVKDDTPNTLWFSDDAGGDFQLGVTGGSSQQIKVSLTANQIKNLGTTPITAIPAQGVGTYIRVTSCDAFLNWNSVAFDGNIIYVGADGSTPYFELGSAFTNLTSQTADSNASGQTKIGNNLNFMAKNTAIVISGTDSVATGDSTIDVYITYEVITL